MGDFLVVQMLNYAKHRIFSSFYIQVLNVAPNWDVIWAMIALMFVLVVVLVIFAILWRPRAIGKLSN